MVQIDGPQSTLTELEQMSDMQQLLPRSLDLPVYSFDKCICRQEPNGARQ